MSFVGVAIGIGAGSTAIGAYSANKAADAQEDSANKAAKTQLQMYYQSREDMMPMVTAGNWARGTQAGYYDPITNEYLGTTTPAGLNEVDQARLAELQAAMDSGKKIGFGQRISGIKALGKKGRAEYQTLLDKQNSLGRAEYRESTGLINEIENGPGPYEESPYYNFLLEEGLKARERSASATGTLGSGERLKDIERFGQGLASTEYNNYVDNWLKTKINPRMALSGAGQVSAGQNAQNAMTTGTNVGNAIMTAGNAKSQGYINQANAITGGINSAADNYMFYNYLNKQGEVTNG